MQQYLDLLRKIQAEGQFYSDRTGTGCTGIFGHQMRFDLDDGFPLLTTKRVHLKSVIHELLWFLSGSTNIKFLQDNGVTIWDEWADKHGEVGPSYGKQWRRWKSPHDVSGPFGHGLGVPGHEVYSIDQVANVIAGLKSDPYGRRHIINAWNPADLGFVKLPWCHCFWQFQASPDGRLHLQLYQRSCDTFLGVPFNIASGALFLMMVAQCVGRTPGEFIWTGGDVHIYRNHEDQVALQLSREPRPVPRMLIESAASIDAFRYHDFHLSDYNPWPAIPAPVAV